jgi:hypothetical protein
MLPTAYATPAAVLFLVGGAMACFAGYRLFRYVLGINGFIIGALVATSAMSASNTWTLAVAAIVGGVVGAVLMIAAYFVGVALVGAGVGAMAVHLGWSRAHAEAGLGAVRSGACVGGLALFGDRAAAKAASAGNAWVVYPLDPAPGVWWMWMAWFALGVVGALVHLFTKGKKR